MVGRAEKGIGNSRHTVSLHPPPFPSAGKDSANKEGIEDVGGFRLEHPTAYQDDDENDQFGVPFTRSVRAEVEEEEEEEEKASFLPRAVVRRSVESGLPVETTTVHIRKGWQLASEGEGPRNGLLGRRGGGGGGANWKILKTCLTGRGKNLRCFLAVVRITFKLTVCAIRITTQVVCTTKNNFILCAQETT